MGSRLTKIRPATPADAEVVARIYSDSWNAGFGELLSRAGRVETSQLIEDWQRVLAQPVPHRWWVAEQVGSIVGFAGVRPSRDPEDSGIGELDTIAVDPSYWRLGIGKALISNAVQHLVSDDYRETELWTIEGYQRGIAFFEAMRWTRDGGIRDSGRQVRLRRDLTPFKMPQSYTGKRPLLLVDVDGVLNPYGFDRVPGDFKPHWLFPEDDEPTYLSEDQGAWLHELADRFDMVWASAWGEDARRLIAPVLDLFEWPAIPFPAVPFEPSEKVPAIDLFVSDRNCAWIEDRMTEEAFAWAAGRKAPTLLIDVDPSSGLTREMVDQLLEWASSIRDGGNAC